MLFWICFAQTQAQLSLDLETGLAFQGYNNVRIPNKSSATKFNFSEDFALQGPVIPFRIVVDYTFNERNHFVALYAPLRLNYEGKAPFDIHFQETLFTKGQFVDGFYKFNSYRLTYRRDLLVTERWTIGLGFTAKIRDARVQLRMEDLSAKKDDLGFVPLLHIYAAYGFGKWTAFLEGDGLAGGPGRAFDFFLGGHVPLFQNFTAKAGYRILEGGADVDEVYNFTLVNFVALGIIWQI